MASEFSPPWRTETLSETCVMAVESEQRQVMEFELSARKLG